MASDVLTTNQYYNYGIDPSNFGKCNNTNHHDLPLNGSNFTSTTAPSVESSNFFYFWLACGIWALTPAGYVVLIVMWLYDFLPYELALYNMIEEQFEKFGLTRNNFREMTACGKLIFLVVTFPIIILMAILQSYILTPLTIIVIVFGNLCPKYKETTFVKRLSKDGNDVKCWEAFWESFFQCLLAMVFYYNNKDSFNCPNSYVLWFDEGTVLIISMVFSIVSITLAFINHNNEHLTGRYGKDWWKAFLCKRPELFRKFWFWYHLLLILGTFIILIGVLIFVRL